MCPTGPGWHFDNHSMLVRFIIQRPVWPKVSDTEMVKVLSPEVIHVQKKKCPGESLGCFEVPKSGNKLERCYSGFLTPNY